MAYKLKIIITVKWKKYIFIIFTLLKLFYFDLKNKLLYYRILFTAIK